MSVLPLRARFLFLPDNVILKRCVPFVKVHKVYKVYSTPTCKPIACVFNLSISGNRENTNVVKVITISMFSTESGLGTTIAPPAKCCASLWPQVNGCSLPPYVQITTKRAWIYNIASLYVVFTHEYFKLKPHSIYLNCSLERCAKNYDWQFQDVYEECMKVFPYLSLLFAL